MSATQIGESERIAYGLPADLSTAPEFFRVLGLGVEPGTVVVDAWHVEESGFCAIDIATGESCANSLVGWARQCGNANVISYVIGVVRVRGRFGIVEEAFFNRLAALAFRGSLN